MLHRFELDSKQKFKCPQCGNESKFVRYFDIEKGEYLSEIVGRCDREVNCGYHMKPKEYFEKYGNQESPNNYKRSDFKQTTVTRSEPPRRQPPESFNYIPFDVFKSSLRSYEQNNLYLYLNRLFGERLTKYLVTRYYLGTSKYLPGTPVFWYLDNQRRITTGKVMFYPDPETGKRFKPETYFNNKPVINWVHSILRLIEYNRKPCFFGEHLLRDEPGKPVIIVESEKTALVTTIFYPDFISLATGGLALSDRFYWELLRDRKVILIPDSSKDKETFIKWVNKAKEFNKLFNLSMEVTPMIEQLSDETAKASGYDIEDFLTRDRDPEQGFILYDNRHPIYWEFTTEIRDGKEILIRYEPDNGYRKDIE